MRNFPLGSGWMLNCSGSRLLRGFLLKGGWAFTRVGMDNFFARVFVTTSPVVLNGTDPAAGEASSTSTLSSTKSSSSTNSMKSSSLGTNSSSSLSGAGTRFLHRAAGGKAAPLLDLLSLLSGGGTFLVARQEARLRISLTLTLESLLLLLSRKLCLGLLENLSMCISCSILFHLVSIVSRIL